MSSEVWIRFLIGGVVVSIFAVLGDLFKPKSFAGLFGAAPSVALATLGMTIAKHGGQYAAVEGRSMMVGAVALGLYSLFSSRMAMRHHWHALPTTLLAMVVWFGVSFGLWQAVLR